MRRTATAGNGFLLRRRWHLLGDDAGRLHRHVVERRELRPEHLRPANRFLLRRRWHLLGDDAGRLLRYVEQWRDMFARPVRHTATGYRLVLLLNDE